MGDESEFEAMPDQWNELMSQMNEQFTGGMEASAEAQARFVESWLDAFESMNDEQHTEESLEGYSRAYSIWMDTAEEVAETVASAASGEDVSPTEIRDLWLENANEAFKEMLSTDAFAAMTGRTIEDALELRQKTDEHAQETLHEFGFATERDIREVGERLVELERRHKKVDRKLERIDEIDRKLERIEAVDRKLDRVLEHLDDAQ